MCIVSLRTVCLEKNQMHNLMNYGFQLSLKEYTTICAQFPRAPCHYYYFLFLVFDSRVPPKRYKNWLWNLRPMQEVNPNIEFQNEGIFSYHSNRIEPLWSNWLTLIKISVWFIRQKIGLLFHYDRLFSEKVKSGSMKDTSSFWLK